MKGAPYLVRMSYYTIVLLFSPLSIGTVTVAALVSGVLSVIATSLIASLILWCVFLRRGGKRETSPGVQQDTLVQQTVPPSTELVEYEIPVFKEQGILSITTQDNVAYSGNIFLQQKYPTYEQVHVK